MIYCGDCLEVMRKLEDNSIDSIVTDPPAGISFMGKVWDKDKGGRDKWIEWMQEIATECLRVIKPGGHCFVWTIPRTSHWTATAWENAGFAIKDIVAHVFGSGFPKSLDIGKKADQILGNEREVVGEKIRGNVQKAKQNGVTFAKADANKNNKDIFGYGTEILTKGTSEWEGWGTALKPAREDWILMRKPIEKGLNIAKNVLKWRTGGINIDECRVDCDWVKERGETWLNSGTNKQGYRSRPAQTPESHFNTCADRVSNLGRFPANLITDGSEEVRECFPDTKSGNLNSGHKRGDGTGNSFMGGGGVVEGNYGGDSGNASRFFKSIKYCAKASKSERNAGCEGLEEKDVFQKNTSKWITDPRHPNGGYEHNPVKQQNSHPTVKPIPLMRYLCRLITPKGGTVLDPFMGSGSTGCACVLEGFDFIGIEMADEYITIAQARIDYWKNMETQEKLSL